MHNLKRIATEHRWALALALLIAATVSLPQVYFRIDHRADGVYQGIELIPDSPWSARVREVLDGHPNFGSIYYADGKDNPYLFQPLGSMVAAYLGEVFNLGINNVILLSRFVFTGVSFLLIYAFAFSLSRRKGAALAGTSLWLFGNQALSFSGIVSILHNISPDDFLNIGRPVNPAAIYIFLFGYLGAFWQFTRQWRWPWGLIAAVLLGLNFYNYFYAWSFLFAFGGVFGLTLLLRRQWWQALSVAVVYLTSLVFAIPYFMNLHRASLFPNYQEVALRNGIIYTHAPYFVGFTVVGALMLFLLARHLGFMREERTGFYFTLSLLLTPFVALNQQILTGKILQIDHYHWFMDKPLSVIIALCIVVWFAERYLGRRVGTLAAIFVVLCAVGVGAFIQWNSYVYDHTSDGGKVMVERQKYGPVMGWLNTHAQKEEVVFGNDETSHMIVIYTPLNVFYHRAGMYSLASTKERLLTQQYAFYRLRGVTAGETHDVFYAERSDLSANIYGIHYHNLPGDYAAIPDALIDEMVEGYRKTLSTPARTWLEQTFREYDVKYVVWDTKADPAWHLEQYPFLHLEEMFGQVSVYRVL